MALSTLLLPTAASAADSSDRRRQHQQQHHSKRKKKPPPSPRTTPPPAAGTSGSRRAASSSKIKSPAAAAIDPSSKLDRRHHSKTKPSKKAAASSSSSSSWEQLKSLLSCRSATAAARVHDPAAPSSSARLRAVVACGASLCSIRDMLIDGGASASSVASSAAPLNRSSRRTHRSVTASSQGHPSSLRGLSGCYECRAINVEPVSRRYPRPRELCPCSQCGEVFTKAESLEHHQAIRHAVSELGPEDSGRNIVEIIFKSSWRQSPVGMGMGMAMCQIERILKVHNPARTVARFEAYRDAVRARCRASPTATAATRAAADGNELLRFHPARLSCALGLAGSSSLCFTTGDDTDPSADSSSGECCGVCAAIRHGFAPWAGEHALGVRTTASSGRAHQSTGAGAGSARAMLVCRVIAGQVRRAGEKEEGLFDSVAAEEDGESGGGAYGSMEELFVANPRAILPCFVVIYRDSSHVHKM